ncbi:MAG TPA: retroviral-like aspartic protease family protein [Allosphingosinicella sp.]|jgi:predicted aspartyl protease
MKLWLSILSATSLLATGTSLAQDPAPADETGEVLGYDEDRWQRMTVPVSIDGRGPYAFVVDTGAERTAIAKELARDLQLGPGTRARLHSMTEVSRVDTVIISALEVAGKSVPRIHAPALQRRHIGAEGILGVDSLQSHRVSFDFKRQEMTVVPSKKREERWDGNTIVVTARSRYGHLVLVDAAVEGQKVWVILDTGAQTSVGNLALRRKLESRRKLRNVVPIEMTSVTGGKAMADHSVISRIRLGTVEVTDMPIAFADVHPFRKLELMDRPAILLGMDALRLFERVSVDFANRRVKLLPPGRSERRGTTFAAAD